MADLNKSLKWAATKAKVNKDDLAREKGVAYKGEESGYYGFFRMWPDIIFRLHGSVIPKILVELFIAMTLGILAYGLTEDVEFWGACPKETCGWAIKAGSNWEKGHGMVGTLIAYLIVLRTQIAWGMYWEGRGHIGALVATTRALGIELLAGCAHYKDDGKAGQKLEGGTIKE